jgi:FlaA1/EpsC-like NDP-sugar epimerase
MMESLHSLVFKLARPYKYFVQIVADAVLLTASFSLAMLLRLESFDFMFDFQNWLVFLIVLPLSLAAFARLHVYRTMVRYVSSRTLRPLLVGVVVSAALLVLSNLAFGQPLPRSVPFIYALLVFLFVGGVRFVMRTLHRLHQLRLKKRVVIYGAGSSGSQLLVSLRQGVEYAPVAFVDDAPEVQGRVIAGYDVLPPSELSRLIEDERVDAVLLAMPSASRSQRKAIIERLASYDVRVQTIPGIADLVSGRASVGEVREVAIEDLLGRDPVAPDERLLGANIRGKSVLVSGAGGSIGSELCRQIIRQGPTCLALFEISEYALYTIHQELSEIARRENIAVELAPLLGSVENQDRLTAILKTFDVATIFHAAAYKHVPLVEQNVIEGVRNNVFGTLAITRAAIEAGVEAFILISTDKAVRPTNVMGASKRMAELVCQASARERTKTLFSMVRFGNVLGSSGSVIPLFRQQIEAGGPITVTHPEITRYFMLIPEAAQLVIQAGAMARGGEVFLLDMGEPIRIVDLAQRMAKLSGLKSIVNDPAAPPDATGDGDIEITFSELRPGEKLYEELLIGGDTTPTAHPRIFSATEISLTWPQLAPILDHLRSACDTGSITHVLDALREAPTGYAPKDGIADFLWSERLSARAEKTTRNLTRDQTPLTLP